MSDATTMRADPPGRSPVRRLAALIAAFAIGAGAVVLGSQFSFGAGSDDETVFVPIAPCRLVDTRPSFNVGPRSAPLPADQEIGFGAHDGTDADSTCAIPGSATAISTNVTAVNPNAASFLTLFPADADRPTTSNLNYLPGAPPTPNAVTVPLSSTGRFNVYNRNGTVDVVIDINGYYQPSSSEATTGPAGPQGPAGTPGADGTDGADGTPLGRNRLPVEDIVQERWDLDPRRGRSVSTGGLTDAIVSDGTSLFISGSTPNRIERRDATTGALIGTSATLPTRPFRLVLAGGSLWAALLDAADPFGNPGTLQRFDPDTLAAVGPPIALLGPPAVVIDAGGRIVVSFTATATNRLMLIDAATGVVIDADPQTGGTQPIDLSGVLPESHGIAWLGDEVVAVGRTGTAVARFDPTAADVQASLAASTVTSPAGGSFDGGDDAVTDGRLLYVTNTSSNRLDIVDLATDERIGTGFGVGPGPNQLLYDGRFLFIIASDALTIFDPTTRSVLGTFDDTPVFAIGFDGANVWYTPGGTTIVRLPPLDG